MRTHKEYQEALDYIKDNIKHTYNHNGEDHFNEDSIVALQELIDKQVPKKPIERHYEDKGEEPYIKYNCPNECKRRQIHEFMSFCPYCGQAIDWSDKQ